MKLTPVADPAGSPIHLRLPAGFVRPGLTFAGWYTKLTGGNLLGVSGGVFTPVASTTIYARWRVNPLVGLVFSDNGGSGRIVTRPVPSGLAILIPQGSVLRRTGYTFRGWGTNPRASRPTIRVGSELVLTHSRVLYALWSRVVPRTTAQILLGSVGVFSPNSAVLTSQMYSYVASLAHSIASRHETAIVIYGYATSVDSKKNSETLSLHRAVAVQALLNTDLARIHDRSVTTRAVGEGRLSNSVLASFRNVEVFAK